MNKEIKSIKELLSDESYHRFVRGNGKIKEVKEWNEWINEDPYHMQIHKEAERVITEMNIKSAYEPDVELARQRFEKKLSNYLSLENSGGKGLKKNQFNWSLIYKIAAAIALLLLSGIFYWGYYLPNRSFNTDSVTSKMIATNYGMQKTIQLTNGSRIILAPNSSITYKSNWLKQPVKKLKLKGAAYFDIKERKKHNHPEFQIETAEGYIRDYGTQFNVSTFNNRTSVVLQKGKISIIKKRGKQREIKLKPEQMAIISDLQSSVMIKKVDPRVYTSWTTHLLYFDHTPLKELTQSLQNRYGYKVIVDDSTLLQKQLSGAIDKTDMKSLLAVVSRVLNIKMTIQGDTVYVESNNLKSS